MQSALERQAGKRGTGLVGLRVEYPFILLYASTGYLCVVCCLSLIG
jgi:hypothetical protein